MEKQKDIVLEDMLGLHPNLFILISAFLNFAADHNLPTKITSIKSDRGLVNSVSSSHQTGRAIDFSSSGWSLEKINEIVKIINLENKDIAAISFKSGKPTAIIWHNSGYGNHFHLQVKP